MKWTPLAVAFTVTTVAFAAVLGYMVWELADLRESVAASSPAVSDAEFNARVERGIAAFVEKQRQLERERPNQLARNVPRPGEDDHLYGSPDAEVSLIEYSDFECPYCKRFHATAKQLVDTSGGRVNWVYRHMPLDFHNPGAQKQAEASECAAELGGNAAFWKYADTIFERTRSNGKGFPISNLVPLAVEIGLDGEAFRRCLDSGRMAARVRRDVDSAGRSGITGTPGNILLHVASGTVVAAHGAQSYERLNQAVSALVRERGDAAP